MPISPYPRPGHPLAPSLLAPLLDHKVPRTDLRFSELDASTWDKFSYERCCRLTSLLTEHLHKVRHLLRQVGWKRLTPSRKYITVHQLELTRRSYNCLSNVSLVGRQYGIASLTVDEALAIRSFDVVSLLDVLTSIEAVVRSGAVCHAPTAGSSRSPASTIPKSLRDRILETGGIPGMYQQRRIPALPEGVTLEQLGLSHRAFNALTRAGYGETPDRIGELTLHQALQIPRFGAHSLCNLLEAIERLTRVLSRNASRSKPRDIWQVLLRRLRAAQVVPPCELAGYLPPLPASTRLITLGLKSGTQRVLAGAGITDDLAAMRAMTLGQLMEIPGFGKACLLDLIEAALRTRAIAGMSGPPDHSPFRETDKALVAICAAPGVSSIGQSDPRLGDLLRSVHVEIKTVGDLWKLRNSVFIATRRDQLRDLRDAVERCRNQTVETELVDLLLRGKATSRNKQMIAKYYGCGGRTREALEAIGNQYDITREHVRQIVAPTHLIERTNSVFLPALDATFRLIHDALPAPRSNLEMRLVQEGLIGRRTSLRCIQFAAERFRPEASFELFGTDTNQYALVASDIARLQRIPEIVRRVFRRVGAGRIRDLLEHDDLASPNQKTRTLVKIAVAAMPDLHWLDPSEQWIWSQRWVQRGLRPKVMQVLAACREVDIDALHAAMLRFERSIENWLPPLPSLLELCRHVEGIRVEGRRLIAQRNADLAGSLKPMEEIIVKLLKKHGPLCRSVDFQDEAFAMGIPVIALRKYLRFSLAITPYAKGVYGVVGQKITPLDLRRYLQQSRA